MVMQAEIDKRALRDDFQIRFDGDGNEIDANTFISYLMHFGALVQEVNKELEPARRIDIKIKALRQGSFLVHIELLSVWEQVKLLFDEDNIEYLANLLGIIGFIYQIKKETKGKKPVEVEIKGDTTIVRTEEGTTIVVHAKAYNIYVNNPAVGIAVAKQFEALEKDPKIERVDIATPQGRPIVEVPRKDFSDLAQPSEILDSRNQNTTKPGQTLSIIKLSFDPKLISDFVYQGNRITAYIRDKDFYDLVDRGESFAKGDTLEVDLVIKQEFDTSLDTYINKGYEVSKVIKHNPRPSQGKIEFGV